MFDKDQKLTLLEAVEALKSGRFIHIRKYENEHGEIANVTVHADASYNSVYSRSADKLTAIEADTALTFDIVRNAYYDATGTEYNRKAKDRTLKTGIKETITPKDNDWAEAIAKVRKSIVDPKTVTDNMEKIGTSVYDNANTNRTYLRNVLIHSKEIIKQGEYPVSCQARINAIADKVRAMLPLGQYRTYILEEGRFEYISVQGESVSSSSSSEE